MLPSLNRMYKSDSRRSMIIILFFYFSSCTISIRFIFELLNKCEINYNTKGTYFDILQRLLQYFGTQQANPRHHNGASLAKFYDFLQVSIIQTPYNIQLQHILK